MSRLDNAEIAAVFAEMADLLQIQGGDRHRVSTFRRVSKIIADLGESAHDLLGRNRLDAIPGLGEGTVHRVKQIVRGGTCDDLERLRAEIPGGVRDMLAVQGIGPTYARRFFGELGIRSIEQLEQAATSGRLATLPRMGDATVQKILVGIEIHRRHDGKLSLAEARRLGTRLVEGLRAIPQTLRAELAGSVRRGKAVVGDLDVLVAADDPGPVCARFVTLPEVESVLLQGTGRASVRLRAGIQADLRVLPPANFGAGLHYFTGSKLHNVHLRTLANRRGLHISDHGIFTSDERCVATGVTEEEIFAAVGLPWIPPELRENTGEFEAAARGRLPELVTAADLRADLHMHTTASDGRSSAREMVERARSLGLEAIAITEHSHSLSVARGIDEARLALQVEELRALQREYSDIRILAGIEVDILRDGSLDLDLDLLRSLDWVIASIHLDTKLDEGAMTRRLQAAIESRVVDCIGHPTGRRPGRRDAYPLDMDAVLDAALKGDVALECNAGPNRMDLDDRWCRAARERGVHVSLNTDAHAAAHLGRTEYGLAMARRGWLEPKHVLTCQSWETLAERRRERLRKVGPVARPRSLSVVETPPLDESHAWGEDPEELAVAGAEAAGAEMSDEQLRAALSAGRLETSVQVRLKAFLGGAKDPGLERLLVELSGNPLQAAFDLIVRDGGS